MTGANSNPRLRIVTGKGGVGKTTVAATMALAHAHKGHRVLVCEVHGRDRISQAFDAKPVGSHMREVFENIYVVDMNPADAMREYAAQVLRFEWLASAVFDQRMIRPIIRLIPSLGELVMLGKVWFHEQEQQDGKPRFDVIIVDAPATGHAMAMLRAPRATVAAVPAGPLQKNAKLIDGLLSDPQRTVIHPVAIPEETPVQEALQISEQTQQLGMRVGTIVINRYVPQFSQNALATIQSLPQDSEVATCLMQRQERSELGESFIEPLKRHVRLPWLAGDQPSLDQLKNFAHRLVDQEPEFA